MERPKTKRFVAYPVPIFIGALLAAFYNLALAEMPTHESPTVKIHYALEPLTGGLKELQRRFTGVQLTVLEKLNRVDLKYLSRMHNIIIPSQWTDNELDYSPFPLHYSAAEKIHKILVVDIPGQAFGGYENGKLVRWGPVSTGRKSRPTSSGIFHLNWRSPGRHSTVNSEWYIRWYFNFDSKAGASLHQYDLPGYPASHECIRLLEADARWLYNWGEGWILGKKPWQVLKQGTPLLILNQYDYSSQPLWRSQEWLNQGIRLPEMPSADLISIMLTSPRHF